MNIPTVSIFESLLDQRVIDIGQDLGGLQLRPHAPQASVLSLLIPICDRHNVKELINAVPVSLNHFELLSTVFLEELSGFLEALVGQLFEGDILARGDGSSSSSRSNG